MAEDLDQSWEFRVWGAPAFVGDRLTGLAEPVGEDRGSHVQVLSPRPEVEVRVRDGEIEVVALPERRFGVDRRVVAGTWSAPFRPSIARSLVEQLSGRPLPDDLAAAIPDDRTLGADEVLELCERHPDLTTVLVDSRRTLHRLMLDGGAVDIEMAQVRLRDPSLSASSLSARSAALVADSLADVRLAVALLRLDGIAHEPTNSALARMVDVAARIATCPTRTPVASTADLTGTPVPTGPERPVEPVAARRVTPLLRRGRRGTFRPRFEPIALGA